MSEKPIWAWLKDGIPKSFFANEHSLLVSYDMMSLMGLDEMRETLNREGEIVTGHLVMTPQNGLFVPFRYDEPSIEAIDYGCHSATYNKCLCCMCRYVSFNPNEPRRNKFKISLEDNAILREFKWRMFSDDKRRRRPLSRLKPLVETILLDLGFQIKSVEFVVSE